MVTIRIIRDEQFTAVAQGILALARQRVDICTYKFEISARPEARALNSLIDTLYALVGRGIKVRVLVNITGKRSGLSRLNESTGRILQAHNIDVKYLPDNRCQHAKVLLVDGCLGIIGSHNWSPRSLVQNFEVSVAINHAGYLADIQAHFEKIWTTAKKV